MKRLAVTATLLLLCISFPTSLEARHGVKRYLTKESTGDIGSLNSSFLRDLQVTYLPGRTITAAKDKGDENAAGNDLYIKFSDVRVDYDNYHLILGIHFIDPKTNAEIASIPVRPYYGNDWGLRNYLKAALDEVGTKLEVEVTGELQGKKKK